MPTLQRFNDIHGDMQLQVITASHVSQLSGKREEFSGPVVNEERTLKTEMVVDEL